MQEERRTLQDLLAAMTFFAIAAACLGPLMEWPQPAGRSPLISLVATIGVVASVSGGVVSLDAGWKVAAAGALWGLGGMGLAAALIALVLA